ncbi:MAG: hypothetical protein IIA41_00710 [SAR324 cluster bacterium]|nr:hypothetical protein [SAR324 cluster bacterium]
MRFHARPVLLPLAATFAALLIAALLAPAAAAHRLRPAIVTMTVDDAGTYEARIVLNMEAVLAGIGPQHQDTSESPNAQQYDTLRALPPEALEERIGQVSLVICLDSGCGNYDQHKNERADMNLR